MEIRNTTTGVLESLCISNNNGVDYAKDFMGDDDSITYNTETGECEADKDTLDWWKSVIATHQTANDMRDCGENLPQAYQDTLCEGLEALFGYNDLDIIDRDGLIEYVNELIKDSGYEWVDGRFNLID